MTQMAGGGLLAFVGGGNTSTDGSLYLDTPGPNTGGLDPMTASPEDLIRRRYIEGGKESDAAKAQREALQASIDERKKSMGYEGLTRFGLDMMAGQSPYALSNIGSAGKETLDYLSKQSGINDADRKELLKLAVETDKNRESREDQMLTSLNTVEANKEVAKMRADQLKYNNAFLQNDKDTKNAQLAINQFEKNRDNYIKEQTKIATANLETIDPLKLSADAYRHAYNTVTKSPIGKYLTTYVEPDVYDVESGYKPAPNSNVVAPGTPIKPGAAPAAPPASLKYDPATGKVISGTGSSVFHF